MGEDIQLLEKRVISLFKQNKLLDIADLVNSKVDEAKELAKKHFSEKAWIEQGFKFRYNWPDGGGHIIEFRDYSFLDKRWGIEKEILKAEHPRRVKRIWEEAKPLLDKRYDMELKDRKDLAVLNGIYHSIVELDYWLGGMNESFSSFKQLKQLKGKKWDDVVKLWETKHFNHRVHYAACRLIDVLKNCENPRIFHDKDDFKYSFGHRTDLLNLSSHDAVYNGLEFMTKSIIDYHDGNLGFNKALAIYAEDFAKSFDIKPNEFIFQGRNLGEFAFETLHKKYNCRKPGDECSKFMEKFGKRVLERWKLTAVDYEKVFKYHKPSSEDIKLMSFFYSIRKGIPPKDSGKHEPDKRIYEGRLPTLLRDLVEEKFINKKDINPPLKKKYLSKDEIISTHTKISSEELEALVHPSYEKLPSVIETEPVKLLTLHHGDQLPALTDDLSELKNILNPEAKYFVLYEGKHTLFLSSEMFFPNGKQTLGEVVKLHKLKPDVNPKEGAVITLKSKRYVVKKEYDHNIKRNIQRAINDYNSDAFSADSVIFITDVSPDEFKLKYFSDFLAHAALHRSLLSIDYVNHVLDRAEEYDPRDTYLSLGATGRVSLNTFELGEKFCFKIKSTGWEGSDNVFFVGKSLTSYLEFVGVGYHTEIDVDENARNEINKKKEEREFQKGHFVEVLDTLKDGGIANVLSHILVNNKYHLRGFGESDKPCEHCGKPYFNGVISFRNEHSNIDFYAYHFHDLACHPHTFVNSFDSFRKVYRIVKESEGHVPVLIEYPELVPLFDEFAKAFDEKVKSDKLGYDHWEMTHGGIDAEPEELEDNPGLKRLVEDEYDLNETSRRDEERVNDLALKLQKRYNDLTGKKEEKKETYEIVNFWSDQILLLNIYQVSAPKLLPEKALSMSVPKLCSSKYIFR